MPRGSHFPKQYVFKMYTGGGLMTLWNQGIKISAVSRNVFAVKKFLAIVDSNIIQETVLGNLITIITLPCKA